MGSVRRSGGSWHRPARRDLKLEQKGPHGNRESSISTAFGTPRERGFCPDGIYYCLISLSLSFFFFPPFTFHSPVLPCLWGELGRAARPLPMRVCVRPKTKRPCQSAPGEMEGLPAGGRAPASRRYFFQEQWKRLDPSLQTFVSRYLRCQPPGLELRGYPAFGFSPLCRSTFVKS